MEKFKTKKCPCKAKRKNGALKTPTQHYYTLSATASTGAAQITRGLTYNTKFTIELNGEENWKAKKHETKIKEALPVLLN